MARIVCDTDFLMKVTSEPLPGFHAFIENSDFVLTTIPQVVRELEGLTLNEKSLTSRKATNVLRLIGTSIHLVEKGNAEDRSIETDLALYEQASRLDKSSFVATLDGKLLQRFEKNKLPYLTLRRNRPFLKSFGRARYLSTKKQ
jgi:rRNA-processing protein FCF1